MPLAECAFVFFLEGTEDIFDPIILLLKNKVQSEKVELSDTSSLFTANQTRASKYFPFALPFEATEIPFGVSPPSILNWVLSPH